MSAQALPIALRWTIGDVAGEGFEALRLAVWGAYQLFGPEAVYTICVNTIAVSEAQQRVGALPDGVDWRASKGEMPPFMRALVDESLAEGKAWKFNPLRLYPEHWEISFDNDCIIWKMPDAIRTWLQQADGDTCLLAEDVTPANGLFSAWTGAIARNSGIRGLPPGFDFAAVLEEVLRDKPIQLRTELDEQGLNVLALSTRKPAFAVSLADVTICSPFPPHLPTLGACGAHFVGLNDRWLAWQYYDRPATLCLREHWQRHRPALYAHTGVPLPETESPASS